MNISGSLCNFNELFNLFNLLECLGCVTDSILRDYALICEGLEYLIDSTDIHRIITHEIENISSSQVDAPSTKLTWNPLYFESNSISECGSVMSAIIGNQYKSNEYCFPMFPRSPFLLHAAVGSSFISGDSYLGAYGGLKKFLSYFGMVTLINSFFFLSSQHENDTIIQFGRENFPSSWKIFSRIFLLDNLSVYQPVEDSQHGVRFLSLELPLDMESFFEHYSSFAKLIDILGDSTIIISSIAHPEKQLFQLNYSIDERRDSHLTIQFLVNTQTGRLVWANASDNKTVYKRDRSSDTMQIDGDQMEQFVVDFDNISPLTHIDFDNFQTVCFEQSLSGKDLRVSVTSSLRLCRLIGLGLPTISLQELDFSITPFKTILSVSPAPILEPQTPHPGGVGVGCLIRSLGIRQDREQSSWSLKSIIFHWGLGKIVDTLKRSFILAISLGSNPKSDGNIVDADASPGSEEGEGKEEQHKANANLCDSLCFAFYLQVPQNFIITIAKKVVRYVVLHMETHLGFLRVANDICVALACDIKEMIQNYKL